MRPLDNSPIAPWRVAIIDDSPDDRMEIRRMLLAGSERQLSFIEASTGSRAIDLLRSTTEPLDCIVLDFYLPDLDAPEVLAALAGPDGMQPCPVVVLTGAGSREEGRRVLRAGAQDYVGKDSTGPVALARTLENAVESWAMARELRLREEALRRVADRETFRGRFRDEMRNIRAPNALRSVAAKLLGSYLEVSRVIYADVIEGGQVVIGPGYVNGVDQIDGSYRLEDYGPWLQETFVAGKDVVITDLPNDANFSGDEKKAFAKLEIVANLALPILKDNRLVAIMSVHQNAPREWSGDDIAIAREIAERIWSAVEHARGEARLRTSEMQLSHMVEIMPSFSAVLRGPEHVFVLANQSYYDLVAHGPEILGKPLRDALPELEGQPFKGLLDEVYRSGVPFEVTGMVARLNRGPGGSPVDVITDFACFALRDGDGAVSGIFIHGLDRTQQFKAAQTLERHERELRSLADNVPDMLSRFDREFRHLFINSIVEKATGRTVAEIIGKTSRELGMEPALCHRWEAAIGAVFNSGVRQSLEYSFEALSGLRNYATRLVPELDAEGRVESVLGITHDVTRRQAFRQQMIEQDRRKDEFLATLAHELRNPLAPIRTGLQLLKLSPTRETVAQTLLIMERQLGQMVRLIDDLLDVSRITSGKIVLKRERVALQDIAASAVETSRSLIDAAAHTLAIDWPAQPMWLDADPTRLSQVFSNLLTNAAKYTRPGGRIGFAARVEDGKVVVTVSDSGLGIPADMLERVFDMFTQVNRTLERAQGGLGIGLSLTRQLVELHGGAVSAASAGVDRGSEFTVVLPLVAVGVSPNRTPAVRPVPAPAAGRRILIVDDNVDAAETMAMLLDLSGYETRTAFSGREALDVARAFQPEMVFLDIGMPGMNGYEVAKKLRANPATASARLIALTGWGTSEDLRKSIAAGFDAHLTKPVEPERVEDVLSEFLPVMPGS